MGPAPHLVARLGDLMTSEFPRDVFAIADGLDALLERSARDSAFPSSVYSVEIVSTIGAIDALLERSGGEKVRTLPLRMARSLLEHIRDLIELERRSSHWLHQYRGPMKLADKIPDLTHAVILILSTAAIGDAAAERFRDIAMSPEDEARADEALRLAAVRTARYNRTCLTVDEPLPVPR
jgi:hypothetical protein